ncbi:nickel-dependent hydrogenase large subunit [Streptomyces griseocarneus]|uniref:nickel-dependent hydrogenase large subunit n=1 Tax=Streptomyces griseocarneus TaxID=51201 RepID=UPI00167C4AE7|nr:nickel-dependent hydrogenase large subunit [Streptomyces griseocarneus]MBZ6475730.1 nickel-dependent hydrogenase large subunit [Streptomyces griseocarneus]GHG51106.1 hydrogenase [Streptomyces griseocarneus]
MATAQDSDAARSDLTDVAFDPITRIIGNLGIYTKIDFPARKVVECRSTSSIFRGYSVFMKGKDPRDAHFITSRICGICGDNHATCSVYAQNMAYGVKPPPLADWIINLGEAAEFMFDHTIFQDNLVFVDFCERMVKETNPGVLERAERTPAPRGDVHGYRTIADIMRAFNPFEGEVYKEALRMSRLTREMCCLMEGRHVHPSTLYPGGVGTVATPQVFTDYLVRLTRCLDFVKRGVALNDDVFDFFYEALPGYEEVGRRRTLLGCWGCFQDPEVVDYDYRNMNTWGNAMFVTPGIVVDNQLVTTDLVDINLGLRVLLGSSYYEDWTGEETYVDKDPLGNPVDQRHPWNQTTLPKPQKRDLDGGNYSWVMSPRWYDKRTGDHLALDTGGGPLARLWTTALAGKVRTPYVRSTGHSVVIDLPKTPATPEVRLEWKPPPFPNTIERDRARMYFVAYAAGMALYFVERALEEVRAGRTKVFQDFKVPKEAIGAGFHEAVRGVLSHHLVIRDRKIANYHPYPPTPWNASPRDHYGTPGPYEDAVQGMTLFEENGPENFKGIDIMRTVRSFDPCLPCGVHMYLGGGRTVRQSHSPTFGALA